MQVYEGRPALPSVNTVCPHRRIWGGGRGGLGPPLEKLISLAGQKRELGRTEMGAWQDRNGSLAGQKWEAWQKIICKTQHFESFSVIFVYFLPLLVGFCHTFLFFSRFCLFFSHLSSNLSISKTVWQDSLTYFFCRTEFVGPA